jgi:hypothetical protein
METPWGLSAQARCGVRTMIGAHGFLPDPGRALFRRACFFHADFSANLCADHARLTPCARSFRGRPACRRRRLGKGVAMDLAWVVGAMAYVLFSVAVAKFIAD